MIRLLEKAEKALTKDNPPEVARKPLTRKAPPVQRG
jgi:hypothetical protein